MNLTSPKISIITPSYKQGRFIEETIRSIIDQTYKNFEIIIIDGGSTDETISVIKKYESYISHWVSEKDSGQSEAINKGLKVATGEIVTWLNSDDYYQPNTLEIIASQFAANPDISIIHGKSVFFGEKRKDEIIGLDEDIPLYEYLPFMRFPQPSSFYRKTVFDSVSITNNLHYAMDFELLVKALLLGFKIKRVDNILSHYRIHSSSKSNDDLKFLEEWSVIVYDLLHSFPESKQYLNYFENLNLVKKHTVETYSTKITLKKEEIEVVFLKHLDLHYHYNYKLLQYENCKKISAFLENNYPLFFKHNHYKKYNLRLKYIPEFIFKLKENLK